MYEDVYARRCTQHGLIIDTNLLALLLVGTYNPNYITKCNRTAGFTLEDFLLIFTLSQKASKIYVTPQILAEVSNMIFEIPIGQEITEYLKQVLKVIESTEEHHSHKDLMLQHPNVLSKFGFADISLIKAAKEHQCLVVTDDGNLTGLLSSLRHDVLNLNSIRSQAWLQTP